jgi:hypothetical protein
MGLEPIGVIANRITSSYMRTQISKMISCPLLSGWEIEFLTKLEARLADRKKPQHLTDQEEVRVLEIHRKTQSRNP